MEDLIKFIKSDKDLETKMQKVCFTVAYSTDNKTINKEELCNVLNMIIFGIL